MENSAINIPQSWEKIDLEGVRGTLMLIGAPDVGKTTFAHYLINRVVNEVGIAGYLDGDPGQSNLGPATTLTLELINGKEGLHSKKRERWRTFVGSTSPKGHMLPLVVGIARLVQAGYAAGARAIVYDTSGLVDRYQGGLALKMAKIDLLQPTQIFTIQRDGELEEILRPLRRRPGLRLVELIPATAVKTRQVSQRQLHRARMFSRYFAKASPLSLYWPEKAVIPLPRFFMNGLVALEGEDGFLGGLGIVTEIDNPNKKIKVITPLKDPRSVAMNRVGSVKIDPVTFRDAQLR
jgi:polynucleotide 5'-hydroxyl-kinase GRC3/NOL9